MISNSPKVSVVIPSYNHEIFITEAISSVLNQTFFDFELIIVDDASTDNSMEVIKQFTDERIKVFRNDENKGAVETLNFAITQSQGKYIALLNSDDVWEVSKLKKQVAILDSHQEIGAVFTDAKFVNEEGKVLEKKEFFRADMFEQMNRSNGQWLKRLFFELNCLCHPSVLIRRETYARMGLYDPALRQLPDFAMWVKLLKINSIYILPEKLVRFRILQRGRNTSANTPINRIRNKNEIYLIMKDFFDEIPANDFIEGFSDFFVKKGRLTSEDILCEQAFIYFKNTSEFSHIYKLIGIEKLYKLMQDGVTRHNLRSSYHFADNDFYQLTGGFESIDASQLTILNAIRLNLKKNLERSPGIYNLMRYFASKLLKR